MSGVTLIPTMQLRFVARFALVEIEGQPPRTIRVLQQNYRCAKSGRTVWKDVPFEGWDKEASHGR